MCIADVRKTAASRFGISGEENHGRGRSVKGLLFLVKRERSLMGGYIDGARRR